MLENALSTWNLKMLSKLVNVKQAATASSDSDIVAMLASKYIFYWSSGQLFLTWANMESLAVLLHLLLYV